jgi:streptomycin 6-kinase
MLEIQPLVAGRARQLGAAGEEWLAGLERLVTDLQRRWSITLGPPIPGGTAAYVARARTGRGRDVVLKVMVPEPAGANQIETLIRARGRGYCRVVRWSAAEHAVLLEPLGEALDRVGYPPERQIDILSRTLQCAWRVEPWPALEVPAPQRKAEELSRLITTLWADLDEPCPEKVVHTALRFADRRARAHGTGRRVVVHGDPHPGNALRAPGTRAGEGTGFRFVDPDGFLEDPAYDLGVVLRDWCGQLLAGDARRIAGAYCGRLAERTGVEAQAIWEWGFIERVSSGLYLLQLGARTAGGRFLETAGRLVEDPPRAENQAYGE